MPIFPQVVPQHILGTFLKKLDITKDSMEIRPIVTEESRHNFLSTRSSFSRAISDRRYLMV